MEEKMSYGSAYTYPLTGNHPLKAENKGFLNTFSQSIMIDFKAYCKAIVTKNEHYWHY